jgi:hypothetical protein
MDLLSLIEAFNAVSEPKIELEGRFRDGHTEAILPRVGRTINVAAGITGMNGPTVQDVAYLCQEARRAADPGLVLLGAALDALDQVLGHGGGDKPAT